MEIIVGVQMRRFRQGFSVGVIHFTPFGFVSDCRLYKTALLHIKGKVKSKNLTGAIYSKINLPIILVSLGK